MKVLWVSRHYPLLAQLKELQRIYGADIEIVQMRGHVPNAEAIVQKAKEVGAEVHHFQDHMPYVRLQRRKIYPEVSA
jgi:hypothetical protein